MPQDNSNHDEQPILSLLQDIKDGHLDPKTLTVELRQRCVEILLFENYAEHSIAQILGRSEKTIKRDLKDIYERNALSPDINLAKQIIGDMVMKARAHHSRLLQLARSKDGSIAEKIQAEFSAWRVINEMVERLQSLGYLPLRPQEIVGDLFHHIDERNLEKSFQDVRKALSDVVDVAQQCGTLTPELQENVNSLQHRVEKAEIVQQVEKLSKQSNEIKEKNHDQQNS
jgi:transposase